MLDTYMLKQYKENALSVVHALCGEKPPTIHFTNKPTDRIGDILYIHEPKKIFSHPELKMWRALLDKAIFKGLYYFPQIAHHHAPKEASASKLYFELLKAYGDIKAAGQYKGIAANLATYYQIEQEITADNLYFATILHQLCPVFYGIHAQETIALFVSWDHNIHQAITDLKKILNTSTRIVSQDFAHFAHITAFIADYLYSPADMQTHTSYQNLQDCSKALEQIPTDSASGDNSVSTQTPQNPSANMPGAEHPSETITLEEDVQAISYSDEDFIPQESVQLIQDSAGGDVGAGEHLTQFFSDSDFLQIEESSWGDYQKDYHIFTTQFDKIYEAKDLWNEQQKKMLQQEFKHATDAYKNITKQLTKKLQAKLKAMYPFSYQDSQLSGILDNKKLPQIVINPMEQYIFKKINDTPMHNIALTLLIDNSGSMRGKPITTAALSAQMLGEALETCGVKVEILGFTTAHWKGGESKKYWQDQNAPPNAGRLNDLMHIIYKQAHSPWKKSKENLALLLKESILKENIDGESLLWASKRLLKSPQRRKILMVISDGAPVDDATLSANDSGFLERHLHHVIHQIEKQPSLELMAIGIGHDVSRYYKNAVTIKNLDQLAPVMMQQFVKMIEKR